MLTWNPQAVEHHHGREVYLAASRHSPLLLQYEPPTEHPFCGIEEVDFPVNLQLPLIEIPHCSLLSKPIQSDDDLRYVLGDVLGHFQRTAVQFCCDRHFPITGMVVPLAAASWMLHSLVG